MTIPSALALALHWVSDWSLAIDGGANAGEWSNALGERFACVHAFEPAADMALACKTRFADRKHIVVHQQALWARTAMVTVVAHPDGPQKTKWRFVQPGGQTEAVAIDDLNLPFCGLIKLDLEGAEMLAFQGAAKTLKRCRPVLIVECKRALAERFGFSADDPGKCLAELGAQEVGRHGPDRVYAWPA